MEDIDIFYGHLVYFTANWNNLCTFGMFCSNLVYFSPFWYVVPIKIWQPCSTNARHTHRIMQFFSFILYERRFSRRLMHFHNFHFYCKPI
jgi:hypothetical protein